jgi:hypothetical protein
MHRLKPFVLFSALNIILSSALWAADQAGLIQRLVSKEGVTRVVARKELKGLTESEKRSLVPGLIDYVKRNDNSSEMLDAIVALGKLGPLAVDAIPCILATFNHQPGNRQIPFNCLVQIGPASVPGLIPLLECGYGDSPLPSEARDALSRIGNQEAKEALAKFPECPTGGD